VPSGARYRRVEAGHLGAAVGREAQEDACSATEVEDPLARGEPDAADRLFVGRACCELSLFSYEILGLVGRHGAGAHDLLRMARRGRILDWAGESRYYVEPKRLAKLGYLDARKERGKTRERTVYSLTDRGLAALSEYARTPARFQPVKSDLLLRLLLADLVGEEAVRTSAGTLREDIADLEARLEESEAAARLLPHRAKCLLLTSRFLRDLLELHLDWVEEIEHELGPGGAG
jgi:DNA-binding PadR family transcriptional regulator